MYPKDLRNHGESPHDRHHDYTSMASDVAGFIIDHNLDEPTIIGHSMLVLADFVMTWSKSETAE